MVLHVLGPKCGVFSTGGKQQSQGGKREVKERQRKINVRKVGKSLKIKYEKLKSGSSFQVLLTNYIIWPFPNTILKCWGSVRPTFSTEKEKRWNLSLTLEVRQLAAASGISVPQHVSAACAQLLPSSAVSVQKAESKGEYQRDNLLNIFPSNSHLM